MVWCNGFAMAKLQFCLKIVLKHSPSWMRCVSDCDGSHSECLPNHFCNVIILWFYNFQHAQKFSDLTANMDMSITSEIIKWASRECSTNVARIYQVSWKTTRPSGCETFTLIGLKHVCLHTWPIYSAGNFSALLANSGVEWECTVFQFYLWKSLTRISYYQMMYS